MELRLDTQDQLGGGAETPKKTSFFCHSIHPSLFSQGKPLTPNERYERVVVYQDSQQVGFGSLLPINKPLL